MILKILPAALYFIVGAISLVMALKSMTARKFLPFHEEAAGVPWDKIQNPLRQVILSFLKIGGAGFLATAVLLMVFPAVNFFIPGLFYKYAVPAVALLFCSTLFVVNYSLHKKTNAQTPWKGSLYAALIIIAGIVISIFN